jgi:hypothetical protein
MSRLRNKVPWLGYRLLKMFSSREERVEILGDFEEGYALKLDEKGRVLAWI